MLSRTQTKSNEKFKIIKERRNSHNYTIIIGKQTWTKDSLLSIINKSKNISIEMFIWSDQDILNAIIDAKKRNVKIKVLLSNNKYNHPTYALQKKHNISVQYNKTTHNKYMIVDDKIEMHSSYNWTHNDCNKNFEITIIKEI